MKKVLQKIKSITNKIKKPKGILSQVLDLVKKKISFKKEFKKRIKKKNLKDLFNIKTKKTVKEKNKHILDEKDLEIHYDNSEEQKSALLRNIIIILFIFVIVGFYAANSVKHRMKYDQALEETEPVKIVIPHPNENLSMEEIHTIEYRVKPGDNLSNILLNVANIDSNESSAALSELTKAYNLRLIKVGQKIIIRYQTKLIEPELQTTKTGGITEYNTLEEIVLELSSNKSLSLTRQENGTFKVEEQDKQLIKYLVKYKVEIKNSLFEDGVAAGVSANTMMDMIMLYSFDVDFQRDIREGDTFEIVYETFYNDDGEKIRDGDILFSSLNLRGQDIKMYRYKPENSMAMYFDEEGKSVEKSLMKTPINGARISSGYGMRRHPILGYSKMHQGMDFAAPSGTPFYAAGDGVITIMKKWSTWGNYVRIRHNNDYATEYAHASRFAAGLGEGSRVRQGQVIAYVGSTGRSTGPHLHYCVLYRGERINPNRVKPAPHIKLKGTDLQNFLKNKELIEKYRLNTPLQNKDYL
jgi:murein DD-endopeptidase MepM/ murein hydrolase activator NlpD